MNELQIFTNEEFGEVRTITEDGKVLFCGGDVATALGYVNAAKAIRMHCKGVTEMDTPTNGGVQKIKYIPESDIYRLIVSSKLPTAQKFEKWVFEDVLPTIRKQGVYMTDQRLQEMLMQPGTIINIALALKKERMMNAILSEDNAAMQPKADYFDALVDRNLLTNIRETAKELKIPERRFASFLLENKFIYRSPKGSLMPYKKSAEDGLFELKECSNEITGWFGVQLLVTPKGRETFRLLCAERSGDDDGNV